MTNLSTEEALGILDYHIGSQRDLFTVLLGLLYAITPDKDTQRWCLTEAVKILDGEKE